MIVNGEALRAIFKSLKTAFTKSLEAAETKWKEIATLVPSNTRETDYRWLSNFPLMRKWVGEKVVKALSAFRYSIVNEPYESTIAVLRDDIEDDNLGIYKPQATAIGQVAAEWPEQLVFQLLKNAFTGLCYDGQPFIDTDHKVAGASVSNNGGGASTPWFLLDTSKPLKPFIFQERKKPKFVSQTNPEAEDVFMKGEYKFGAEARGNAGYGLWQLAFGSKQTLDKTNFRAAVQAMRTLKSDEGVPLNINPTVLVVPPSLEGAAEDLILVKTINGDANPLYNKVKVIVSPWIE